MGFGSSGARVAEEEDSNRQDFMAESWDIRGLVGVRARNEKHKPTFV